MNAETAVRDLCKAFSRMDVEEILARFTEDAVYEKMPVGRFAGKEEIRGTLAEFFGPGVTVEFEILNLAADEGRVLTERVVHFTAGGNEISLPVMGIFEVAPDGRIAAWRDYFDKGQAGLV
ncbi:MAG: nuclear transport factor 2 family protein [Deltaproteobacteria bacterium]|nr:nuclear transport factor 2 family protein [Deltaproteobacteria bacterium]MBW2360673.1 nuclear transport factor 2 family protein [Deltaproteobacteria bacterium]